MQMYPSLPELFNFRLLIMTMLIPRLVITMQRHTDGKDKRRLQTGPSCSDATWKLQLAAGVAVATRPNFSLPLEMQSFVPVARVLPLSLCFLLDMIIMSAESSQDYADRVARGKGDAGQHLCVATLGF